MEKREKGLIRGVRKKKQGVKGFVSIPKVDPEYSFAKGGEEAGKKRTSDVSLAFRLMECDGKKGCLLKNARKVRASLGGLP